RVEADRTAAQVDLTLVRLQVAEQDVHQGRLAGTVFAQQGVDLLGADVEVDVVVGQYPVGEAFRDAAGSQELLSGLDVGPEIGVHAAAASFPDSSRLEPARRPARP